jgi:serine/threonine protein kinase
MKILQREWTANSMLSRALNAFISKIDDSRINDDALSCFNNFSLIESGCNGAVLRCSCSHPEVVNYWERFSVPQEQRVVALKMLFNLGHDTRYVRDRFRNEYRVLQRLEPHPNIVTLLNHFVAHPSNEITLLFPPECSTNISKSNHKQE